MGRAHSNAYRQVGEFLSDCSIGRCCRPYVRAMPASSAPSPRRWGYAVGRDRLAPAGRARRHRCGRHLRAEQPARGDRAGGGRGREDDPVREAAGDERGRGRGDGGGRRGGGRAHHGLVQLSAPAGGEPGAAAGRRGPHRPALPLPGAVPAGLDHRRGRAAGRRGAVAARRRAAGSGVTGDLLAHYIDTAMWLNGPITRVMAETETFVKERLHQETGKVEPVASTMPASSCAGSPTARWGCSRARATPAATRRSRPSS